MNKEKYEPLHILCRNGWTWHCYRNDPIIQMNDPDDEYEVYTNTFLGWYTTTVRAAISQCSDHLCIYGHYGVLWLDVVKYECDPPYSRNDMEDMLTVLKYAEEHLLKIGMPFTPDYKFHGNDPEAMRQRNMELRQLYDLDALEKEHDK